MQLRSCQDCPECPEWPWLCESEDCMRQDERDIVSGARCGFCGEATDYKPAQDAEGFLCSRCVQLFLVMSQERKLAWWRELNQRGDLVRCYWLESFIEEEVLRRERRSTENGEFLYRGHTVGPVELEEGNTIPAEDGKAVSLYSRDQSSPPVLFAKRGEVAAGE